MLNIAYSIDRAVGSLLHTELGGAHTPNADSSPVLSSDRDDANSDETHSQSSHSDFVQALSTPHRSPTPQPSCLFLSPLRREVDSLPLANTKARCVKLMQMSSYEFSQECNIAKNWEISESLGLRRNLFGDKNMKKNPQHRSNKSKNYQVPNSLQVDLHSCRPKRKSIDEENVTSGPLQHGDEHLAEAQTTPQCDPLPQDADEPLHLDLPSQDINELSTKVWTTSTTSSNGGSLQEADEPWTEACITPCPEQPSSHCVSSADFNNLSKTVATAATLKPTFTVNRTAWPEWLAEKYDYYTGLEFGDRWKECIIIWTQLERTFGF